MSAISLLCLPFPFGKQCIDTMRCLNRIAISSGLYMSFSIQNKVSSHKFLTETGICHLSIPIFLFVILYEPAQRQTLPYILLCKPRMNFSDKIVPALKDLPSSHLKASSIFCCSNSSNSPRVAMVGINKPSFSSSSSPDHSPRNFFVSKAKG